MAKLFNIITKIGMCIGGIIALYITTAILIPTYIAFGIITVICSAFGIKKTIDYTKHRCGNGKHHRRRKHR